MVNESGTNSVLTRRGFLKTTAAAGAASIAMGAAPSLAALADERVTTAGETIAWNMCRGNCGGGSCRLKGIVMEGKLVQCRPADIDPAHPAVKTGCVKGQTNPQRLYSPRRVLYPLKRVGERGSGDFERISWDEAIALVAQTFEEAQEQYGESATAIWQSYGGGGLLGGVGWYFAPFGSSAPAVGMDRFLAKTGATVLTPGGDLCQMWMNATFNLKTASPEGLEPSKTLIFWGSNLTESCRDGWHYACKARENGATLISINPHYNTTAAGSDM